jgi:hypothetical protein
MDSVNCNILWTIQAAAMVVVYESRTGRFTIHEPSAIGGDVRFQNGEVKIAQDLHHLQQNAVLVHAVHLTPITRQTKLMVRTQIRNDSPDSL